MADGGWTNPLVIMSGASSMFAYRLCVKLVEKGVLTQQDAANVFIATADDIRSGSEDGAGERLGEVVARDYEKLAALVLGSPQHP